MGARADRGRGLIAGAGGNGSFRRDGSRLKGQFLGSSFFELLFRSGQRDRFDLVPQWREVAVVARKDMARFAGCDHEARFVRVCQIIKTAKTAPLGAGEWQIRENFEAAAPIEGVEAAARGNAEVAQTVKERDMAVDLMLQHRSVLRPPAPMAHIGAVALNKQGQSVVEGAPERFAAIRIGSAWKVAPEWMVAHQRDEGCRGERALLFHRQSGFVLDQDFVE